MQYNYQLYLLKAAVNLWEDLCQQVIMSLDRGSGNQVGLALEASTGKHSVERDTVDIALDNVIIGPFAKHSNVSHAHTAGKQD